MQCTKVEKEHIRPRYLLYVQCILILVHPWTQVIHNKLTSFVTGFAYTRTFFYRHEGIGALFRSPIGLKLKLDCHAPQKHMNECNNTESRCLRMKSNWVEDHSVKQHFHSFWRYGQLTSMLLDTAVVFNILLRTSPCRTICRNFLQ